MRWWIAPRSACRNCTPHNRELHFSHDKESGRVIIEVRDLEGNVLKTIPPSKAMDILSGADL